MKTSMTRRDFLKKSLWGAGLTIAVSMGPSGYRLLKAQELKTLPLDPHLWIHILPENIVTVVVNKSEMGQGVTTALPMIAADELGAEWKQVRFVEAPASEKYIDPNWGMQLTGGSTSLRHEYEYMRKLGAATREMLILAAAQTWNVSANECEALQGTVKHSKSGKSLTYGQLSERASRLPVPQNPALKQESQFKIIGKPMDRLDVSDKVNGSAVFGLDIFVPGMLYGAFARPPAYGAKAKAFNQEAAEEVPGVFKVISTGHGIAVCGNTLEAAWNGRDALQVQWGEGADPGLTNETLEKSFIEHLSREGLVAQNKGDIKGAMGKSIKKMEATYFLPYLAHVTMEPMDCTVSVGTDRCEIWVPTQYQSGVLQTAVKITGLKPEQIAIHTTYLGGGFGRRAELSFVEEALEISKAAGKPVKMIWTREEDIQNDLYRPGNCCKIIGGIDDKGNLIAWSHKIVAPSIFERFAPQMMKNGIDPAAVEGVADMEYEVPNLYVEYVKMVNSIPVGFWRSVGNSHNAFTKESFMDEMAHAAKKDPLEFRLALLKNDLPARRVLQTAADKAGWKKTVKKGHALGLAYHFSFGTRVAQVAEVSVNQKDGTIKVHKVVCAVDCGPVINPAIVTAQIKGAIIMGLSAALKERVDFEGGGVATANFYNYQELRMSETPEIEVHLIKSKESMGGIGEPGLPPIAPAVANAVFNATGVRIRRLPMNPDTVMASMKKKR